MTESSASSLIYASASHAGQVQQTNQDSVFVGPIPSGALALVADGMGGHNSGELASQKARDILVQALSKPQKHPPLALARAVQQANLAILDYAEAHPESQGMGTTLTALIIDDHLALIAHVGDSRAYLIRGGTIRQLTFDHSWVADRVRQGLLSESEAKRHQWRNIITNAVGSRPVVRLELSAFSLEPGDQLLLCSDGLNRLLSDELILQIVQSTPPSDAVATLLERADERGSPDNVSTAVLKVTSAEARPKVYTLPDTLPVSVELGENGEGLTAVEAAFPYRGRFSRFRRHPLYPYRWWLLGCLYLLALFIYFSLP